MSAPDPIALPDSGAKVEFCDPKTLRNRDRKKLLLGTDGDGVTDLHRGLAMTDGLIALLVTAWDAKAEDGTDLPLPSVSPDVLDDLTIPDYDALAAVAQVAQKALFPGPGA